MGAQESRFDWPAIMRVSGIIVGVSAAYGLIVPVAGALAVTEWDTLKVSGNEIYRWLYWAIAWGLTVWQGSWMRKAVHDRIIDDMIVVAVITAIALIIVKVIIWFIYEPVNSAGTTLLPITSIDAGGALIMVVVAFIGAGTNRF